MQKVYIRGVKGRGKEVIAKLEALGGKNIGDYECENEEYIYFLDVDNIISYKFIEEDCAVFIMWCGTEILLDEPKPIEYKFNIGDKVRDTTAPEFRYTVKDRHSIDGQVVYMLEHELGGETPHNEKYLELIPRITESIRTFGDAYEWCLANNPDLCTEYNECKSLVSHQDIIAYLKLRIIAAALNEGWEPLFTEDEERWYPRFVLYSADELAEKSEEWKAIHVIVPLADYRVVGRPYNNSSADGGLVYAFADFASSYSHAHSGSRLAFKTETLANYAASQFASLWADFYISHK